MAVHATCCCGYLTGSCTPPSSCLSLQPANYFCLHYDANKGIRYVIVIDCISFAEVFNDLVADCI